MSSNIFTTTNSNTTSSILRKRFREEIADETIQPPMKRMRMSAEPQEPAPQEQDTTLYAGSNSGTILTASENTLLTLLKALLENTSEPEFSSTQHSCISLPTNTTTTTLYSYDIAFPTPNGVLHFHHPFTILHYLRFWDNYNEQCSPHEVILLPALSNELIEAICDHHDIRHPIKIFEDQAKELKERLERHRDMSGDSDLYG